MYRRRPRAFWPRPRRNNDPHPIRRAPKLLGTEFINIAQPRVFRALPVRVEGTPDLTQVAADLENELRTRLQTIVPAEHARLEVSTLELPSAPPHEESFGLDTLYPQQWGSLPSLSGLMPPLWDSRPASLYQEMPRIVEQAPPPTPRNAPGVQPDAGTSGERVVPALEAQDPPDEGNDGAGWNQHVGKAKKYMYYFKGNIRKQQCNALEEPTQEKQPLFVQTRADPVVLPCDPPKCDGLADFIYGNRKWLLQHMASDDELVNYLRLEAAFVPRTMGLLLQLKIKAKRFMDQLDCSRYTRREINDIIIRAVGIAMCVDKEEEKVRLLLALPREITNRERHSAFFREGVLAVGRPECLRF